MTHLLPPFPIRVLSLDLRLAVCRLAAGGALQPWMQEGRMWSITRTAADEVSVVVEAHLVPHGITHEGPFAAFMVEGPLDFALTGILSRLVDPLAAAGVPVFVLSTFDTDYVLVRVGSAVRAVAAWTAAGLTVIP